jgi:hypothetical protein
MRTRKPVNVKAFSIAHNFVMFWLSLYMVVETVTQVRERGEEREREREGWRVRPDHPTTPPFLIDSRFPHP